MFKKIGIFAILLTFAACNANPVQTPTPVPVLPTATEFSSVEPKIIQPDYGRGYHLHNLSGERFDYLHREVLQTPLDMVWGSNNDCLYIADWLGRHIVKIFPDGTLEEIGLGIWEFDGPRNLAFDVDGNLYASDHSQIIRFNATGSAELVFNRGAPSGGIAFNSENELYFANRDLGQIYVINDDGNARMVVSDIENPENPIFGPDGLLYISQMHKNSILSVDVNTGEVRTFFENDLGGDPVYLSFDDQGNLWARGLNHLYRINPKGEEISITINGIVYYGNSFFEELGQTAGGIAHDPRGNVWIGSYTSRLDRLDLNKDGTFTHTAAYPGFNGTSITFGPDGMIYTYNDLSHEIWQIDPQTEIGHSFFTPNVNAGKVELAFKQDGSLFMGLPTGVIAKLNAEGDYSEIVRKVTRSMTIGDDGELYAVIGDYGQEKSIAKIEESGQVTTLIGDLGKGEFHIEAAQGGFFVFAQGRRELLFLDKDGTTTTILTARDVQNKPAGLTVSPQGDVYLIGYEIFRVTKNNTLEKIVSGVWGDPVWGITSLDGSHLYILESGAIDNINLSMVP